MGTVYFEVTVTNEASHLEYTPLGDWSPSNVEN